MPDTFTPNYNLTKPEVGSSRDAWGGKWNGNADALDTAIKKVDTDAKAAIAAIKTMPPGAIVDFAQPYFAPDGWLKCNGAAISRTTYAALFAAIGTWYGAGDGSTTFNIPDIRGLFRRGLDDGKGVDPSSTRVIGSYQGDSFRAHNHPPANSGAYITGYGAGAGSANVATGPSLQIDSSATIGGAETRPQNIAFPAYIKY